MRIRVMGDYQCWATWRDGPGPDEIDTFDPATLPIGADLVAALHAWSLRLDESLDWDDPGKPVAEDGFLAAFNAEGRALTERLRAELGEGYAVRYHPIGETL